MGLGYEKYVIPLLTLIHPYALLVNELVGIDLELSI